MAPPIIIGSPPPQIINFYEFCGTSCPPPANTPSSRAPDCFCKPNPALKVVPPAKNNRFASPLTRGKEYIRKAAELVQSGRALCDKVELYLSNPPPTIWFP